MLTVALFSLLSVSLVAEPYTCDELASPRDCPLVSDEGYLMINGNGQLSQNTSEPRRRLYWVRYRSATDTSSSSIPILLVHGGPGLPADYIDSMKYLACYKGPGGQSYSTVFYHQMCVGKSNIDCQYPTIRPEIPALFTVEYYGRELRSVISALFPQQKIHLLGQSWGAVVSLTFIVNNLDMADESLLSFISANGGVPNTIEFQNLIKTKHLPNLNRAYSEVLLSENVTHPRFAEALQYYQAQYYVQFLPRPDCVARADQTLNLEVFLGLFAACPWCPSDNAFLKVDLVPRLRDINVPTLAFYGETDITDNELLDFLDKGFRKEVLTRMVLPRTSHMPWVENFEMFYDVVTDWLDDEEITRDVPRSYLINYKIGKRGYLGPRKLDSRSRDKREKGSRSHWKRKRKHKNKSHSSGKHSSD